jgi:hypothetical protein
MPGVREIVVVRREPLVEKVCPVCGRTFEAVNRRLYCSSPCRHRAYYWNHAEERRAGQRDYDRERRRRGRSTA